MGTGLFPTFATFTAKPDQMGGSVNDCLTIKHDPPAHQEKETTVHVTALCATISAALYVAIRLGMQYYFPHDTP
jgi:hypothetical protein